MPEYRQLRADLPMLQACMTPELICEITLQPVRRHGVDAAILFSDIMLPLHAAGIGLDIVPGTGPVVNRPVRSASDVAALPALEPEAVEPVAAAVRLLVAELGQVPLIGFAGAPFTLASYLIEGGPSRHHERTKAFMHSQPDVWHALLNRLAEISLTFLRVQAAAGVDAVQLFDSWAGALSQRDYRHFVFPHSARVLAGLADTGVPRIHFRGGHRGAAPGDGPSRRGCRRRRLADPPGRGGAARAGRPNARPDRAPGQPRPGCAAGWVAYRRRTGAPGDR